MIEFIKFANERRERYRVATEISLENGRRIVRKKAMGDEACKHIRTIAENAEILAAIYGKEHVAGARLEDEHTVVLEYVEGTSLHSRILAALERRDRAAADRTIRFFIDEILAKGPDPAAGSFQLTDSSAPARDSDIDLDFDNVILTQDGWKIIDYEWLFPSVPRAFLLGRALRTLGERSAALGAAGADELLQAYGAAWSAEDDAREKAFYSEVLTFPMRPYEKRIYDPVADMRDKRDAVQRDLDITRKERNAFERDLGAARVDCETLRAGLHAVRGERDGYRQAAGNLQQQVNELRQGMDGLRQSVNGLQTELDTIHGSRGWRLLTSWYRLRDHILPPGSLRRKAVKLSAWALLHPQRMLSLLTWENLHKSFVTFRAGGLRALAGRVDAKLHAPAVTAIPDAAEITWLNDWLEPQAKDDLPEGTVIDIIVPIYGAYDFTRRCLASVYDNTDIAYELYLVDDKSPDERIGKLLDELDAAPRPAHMQALHILRNEENLGFIGSVNRAFAASKHDAVLLNTDTEVPPGWLSRLVAPLYADEHVASVTPYANSATICSFPVFNQNNDLPDGLSAEDVDACIRQAGGTPVTIPTGVGFAMAVRRQCLDDYGAFDTTYGKGYGEENDWCCRVAAHGYRHVHVTNLFIYHKHGASFGERKDKKRDKRIEENLAKLAARYPDYSARVQDCIARDPERQHRSFLRQIVHARRIGGPGVLCICHASGGGTLAYQEQWIGEHADSARIYTLTALADGRTAELSDRTGQGEEKQYLDMTTCTEETFRALVRVLGITEIRINHLISFPLQAFLHLIAAAGVPYHFFAHDYYAVCPSYTLIDGGGHFCGVPGDLAVCDACLRARHEDALGGIRAWRDAFGTFLAGAVVTAPSQATADLIRRAYPDIQVGVVEHHLTYELARTYRDEFAAGQPVHIAAIGALSPEKGADILYEMADIIRERHLPIRLHLIGYTYRQSAPDDDGVLAITGRYDPQALPQLLADARAAAVIIPAVWPETYCYTASEAMACGYPVYCYDLGAPPERVRRTGQGRVVSEMTAGAMLRAIEQDFLAAPPME